MTRMGQGFNADWTGFLDRDEKIIWQGRPSGKIRLEFKNPFEPLFFTVFTGFSAFWMIMASKGGGIFWTFGLPFFVVGAYALVGMHFWKAFVRQNTFLTLTDRRAVIATDVMGKRRLKSYPIRRDTTLEFVDGELGSIFFATEVSKSSEGDTTWPVGFELIENARNVFALFRAVQEKQS